mgnify:CR=1 FL=1
MKRISVLKQIFVLIFILSLSSVYAQQGGGGRYQHREDRKKIETQKIAYITDRLDLSVEEAEKFWPVYNKHHDAIAAERSAFRDAVEQLLAASHPLLGTIARRGPAFIQQIQRQRRAGDRAADR